MRKDKIIGTVFKGAFMFVTGALGETLGETVGYGLKLKLFPEFREAELESARRSIEEANWYRKENEKRKKKKEEVK